MKLLGGGGGGGGKRICFPLLTAARHKEKTERTEARKDPEGKWEHIPEGNKPTEVEGPLANLVEACPALKFPFPTLCLVSA